ncbi:bifunctional DNA-formamidopyrimidine glycosylase/DNA-(apurinic or apyrimidinic site) lyase [Aureimonas leprariae]|uniref:Formamidopyrimidine-DNA glycosylase n=1 Tax=Plantimonas leprariae TaxID=2615207 RepID=A0A7V7PT63_9HYPH|nr:bifunctional DNA-formamidopyrimidine glycosylase/DNA-(apurinic or apyrimidinic site) lyase [Aureimonas leprariae]KAB0682821.1 bifunctional DNA-formamidopyrimidine glycosylase/DNA-(apurinic or apyrimidinic site) lyase [Aureimonas leprariae]
MPELPEVETVRRGLQPFMEGATIRGVELRRPTLRFPLPERFAERLEGRRIDSLARRAKYLVAHLSGGMEDLALAMHLGMSGSFRIEPAEGAVESPGEFLYPRGLPGKHDHVVFHLDSPERGHAAVVFNDPRRFGYMTLIEADAIDAHPHFRGLGVEPLGNELAADSLAPFFARRLAPLKSVLLDQRVVAGLGNIYVCESLWRAELHPGRAAGTVVGENGEPTVELERLVRHIREMLDDAILAGGSSLRDYRQADGSRGSFQDRFAVYDREGEPCRRQACGGTVGRIVQSGRSTFFCPVCQH